MTWRQRSWGCHFEADVGPGWDEKLGVEKSGGGEAEGNGGMGARTGWTVSPPFLYLLLKPAETLKAVPARPPSPPAPPHASQA